MSICILQESSNKTSIYSTPYLPLERIQQTNIQKCLTGSVTGESICLNGTQMPPLGKEKVLFVTRLELYYNANQNQVLEFYRYVSDCKI